MSGLGASSIAVVKTLLLTDLVGSTKLLEELGDQRAAEVSRRHDLLARDLLRRFPGREIDKTDGFLFLFDRPIDAVEYSLAYHRGLRQLSLDLETPLEARAGIHLGEVFTREASPEEVARGAKPLDIEGLAKPIAARIMSLAGSGQTLLSRAAFEIAKRAAHGTELERTEVEWLSHGTYQLKGVDEPLEIFEVGEPDVAPLTAPRAGEKARAAAPRISTAGERRQVTVVHSQLPAFSSLEEHLDPEATEVLVDRLHTRVAKICSSHGGLLHQFSGDAVVVLFGLAETREDDTVRAVRAAVEMRACVQELSAELEDRIGKGLRLHTGIVTGPLVARRQTDGDRGYRISGQPVRMASTLAIHAAADEILLSPESSRLAAPVFESEPGSPISMGADAKPLVPCRLHGEASSRSRLEAAGKEGLSTYSGRDLELQRLTDLLQAALAGSGQFVTVEGDAGVGKSRLLYELQRREDSETERLQILVGRCQSHQSQVPYLPFVEVLHAALGGADDGSEIEASAAIERLHKIDPQLEDFLPLYFHLLSIVHADYPLPRHLEGKHFHHAMLEALAGILTLYTESSPVLLILEDWHWADDASREVLRQVAEMAFGCRMLVVVTYRPENTIDWGSPENHSRIELGALDSVASKAIMQSALGAEELPEDLSAQVHHRSGGNAFFIEEICRALLEEGRIVVEGASAVLRDVEGKLELPETVQAVLHTRIDRLDPEQREVLKSAAVVGREISLPLLEHILPNEIDLLEVFGRLKSAGLMQQVRLLPEAIYRFRHNLTQEVAYDSILAHERRTIHGKIAKALELLYPERLEERLDLLAQHCSQAEEWQKAAEYARRAAARHSKRSQYAAASRVLEEARGWIRCLPKSEDRNRDLVELLLELERACETAGEVRRQQEIIDELHMLLAGTDDIACQARAHLRQGELHTLLRRFEEAEASLFRAEELSRSAGDRRAERDSLRSLGFLRWQEDRDREALEYGEQALAVAREIGSLEAQARDLTNLGSVLRSMERHDQAIGCLEEALELCEEACEPEGSPSDGEQLVQMKVETHHIMGTVYRDMGRNAEALRHFERSLAIGETLQSYGANLFFVRSAMANLFLELGDSDKCIDLYRAAIEASRKARYQHGLSRSLFGFGDVLAASGRVDEARECFVEAAAVFAQMQDHDNELKVWARLAKFYEDEAEIVLAREAWAKTLELAPLGEPNCTLVALEGTARLSRAAGDDPAHTSAAYDAAIQAASSLGNRAKEADLLNTLGIVEWGRGQYEKALSAYEQALEIFRELADEIHEGLMLNSIGATLRKLDQPAEARQRLEEAVEKNRRTGQRLLEGHGLAALGDLDFENEDLETAREYYQASLRLRRDLEDRKGEAWMLYHLARTELTLGDQAAARELLGAVAKAAGDQYDTALETACGELERRTDAEIHH